VRLERANEITARQQYCHCVKKAVLKDGFLYFCVFNAFRSLQSQRHEAQITLRIGDQQEN
jgi:hypothetical protein